MTELSEYPETWIEKYELWEDNKPNVLSKQNTYTAWCDKTYNTLNSLHWAVSKKQQLSTDTKWY